MRELVNEVIKKNVAGDVKSGVFYEDLSDLTLYAERVARKGEAGGRTCCCMTIASRPRRCWCWPRRGG